MPRRYVFFPRRPVRLSLFLAAAGALLASGCIRSRVTITSEPTGAEVIWRGQPYAATPVTIPFVWYWYYDFSLEKPGYKRLDVLERFRTPNWALLPLDLVMEILPIPIPDDRVRKPYILEPLPPGETVEAAPIATEITPQSFGLRPPPAK
jgi:hypothetical protein